MLSLLGSKGGHPQLEGTNLGVFVPRWPVSSHTNVMTGHIGTKHPNLYPLAGDDRPLTLLRRGCANSGGFGSETGQIRFRGAPLQTPSSVSFFGAHRVPGSELSEFLSAFYLCNKANSPSFSQNSPSLPQNSVRLSEFSCPKQYSRNSIPPVSYSSSLT